MAPNLKNAEAERLADEVARLFGRGRHRAYLDFGDCQSYAVARLSAS